jgi:hypothetical protein
MRCQLLFISAVTLLGATGCASPERRAPASPRDASAALSEWVSAEPTAAVAPRSVKLSALAGGTVHIEPPPAPPARPRLAKRVALELQRADLVNAMQLLADAGRFNLVLESGLSGQVSASLLDVEPYEALVALASANGARVEYENRIVVVRKR